MTFSAVSWRILGEAFLVSLCWSSASVETGLARLAEHDEVPRELDAMEWEKTDWRM